MTSWSQKIGARNSPADSCIWNIWGGLQRFAATPLIVPLSLGHSDMNSFLQWSPITTGNILNGADKFPKFAQTTGSIDFLIIVPAFRDQLRGELPNLQIFMNDGPISSHVRCPVAQLLFWPKSGGLSSLAL
jgi:hypothetical protein